MAWPESLNSIRSNLNTSELWMLQESMSSGKYTCEHISGFAEYKEFDVLNNGERYHFEEHLEVVNCIMHRKRR